MNNKSLDRIIREGAMSESIAMLVFTDDPSVSKNMLLARSLVRTAYRICLFYSALVQAYAIGRAIHCDCTISELPYPARLIDALKRSWSGKSASRTENSRAVISFILECCECGVPDIMAEGAISVVRRFRDAYERYISPTSRALEEMNEDDLIALLKAFPLLSTTTVDFKSCTFAFESINGDRFEIVSSPFIYFFDSSSNSIVQHRTNECLVFTGVSSENNGQLIFSTTELQKSLNVRQQTRLIRRQVSQNEHLRLICKAAEMNIESYSVEECLCDLAFLDHLTNVTRTTLSRFWKSKAREDRFRSGKNIAPKLRELFYGTDIYSRIPETQAITIENIDGIFYELYINCGAFKTMTELLLDYPGHEFGGKLFQTYMEVFEETGRIDAKTRKKYEDECRSNIESRLRKLSGIVQEGSMQYDNRKRALKAEWRAFCVLKAAGIQAKNLFTDEEEILSISDYYDKIKNPESTIQADLNNVLIMLIEIYDAILKDISPADEKAFKERVLSTRERVQGFNTRQLLGEFSDIIRALDSSPMTMQYLGRQEVCNHEEFEGYVEEILATIDSAENQNSGTFRTKQRIFISYAHEDKSKVKKYYERWSQCGYEFFFDEEKLSGGDRWRTKANHEIESEDCVAVFVFMSRAAAKSQAVSYELEHAKFVARQKFPNDRERQDRYIIPINLEDDDISVYLREVVHSSGEHSEYAMRIREILSSEKVYYNYSKDMETAVEQELERLLKPGEAGELVREHYNDFEVAVANFYAFLKYGDDYDWTERDMVDAYFKSSRYSVRKCIFPLVASVKETKIKRDNTTLVAYELMEGKGASARATNYILSSKRLPPDDYFCIPNARTTGEDCSWMVEPYLIRHDLLAAAPQEE